MLLKWLQQHWLHAAQPAQPTLFSEPWVPVGSGHRGPCKFSLSGGWATQMLEWLRTLSGQHILQISEIWKLGGSRMVWIGIHPKACLQGVTSVLPGCPQWAPWAVATLCSLAGGPMGLSGFLAWVRMGNQRSVQGLEFSFVLTGFKAFSFLTVEAFKWVVFELWLSF